MTTDDRPLDATADEAEPEPEATFFVEAPEVLDLVKQLRTAGEAAAAAAQKIADILDKYQEQPGVLDPQLGAVVAPVLEVARAATRGTADRAVLPPVCRVVYALCKVRGYKTIVKFVPHEVADLEPLVALLATVRPADHASWQIAYALMVWLSMVVMVPFDLTIIDSSGVTAAADAPPAADASPTSVADDAAAARPPLGPPSALAAKTLVGAIERLALQFLDATGPARDAAAVLLARLLTRPGLQPALSDFVAWSVAELDAAASSSSSSAAAAAPSALSTSFLVAGVHTALAHIFKLGHRSDLLGQLPRLGPLSSGAHELLASNSVTKRKLGIKLLQRVGLVYLPPRVASWRYQRGNRSLLHNLQASGAPTDAAADADVGAAPAPAEEEDEEEGEEALVAEEVEGVLEQLLTGLKDADTVVRWSAAKGVGRLTGRLPLELADDVVEQVLELLTPDETPNSWHGGCLALAELSRRGLLLPARLPEVLPRVTKALHFDVARGASSVGTHVRDAACYVTWAFARAFEPAVMAPHVAALAPALLVLVVFDREVNVRRAAAAAFQEHVGRQGSFPHGIEIVTRADYFAVGSRVACYLEIAPWLAAFEAYRMPLLRHLCDVKARHWDESLRLLSAKAAARLAPLEAEWVVATMIPDLCGRALSPDLKERHGATHMAAEVLLGVANAAHGGDGGKFPPETRKQVGGLVPAIEKARLYRGRGGEVMRGATCRMLEVCATIRMPCSADRALKQLVSIDDSLKHPTEAISRAAVAALRAVGAAYFADDAAAAAAAADGTPAALVARYAKPLGSDPNAGLRRGYALAIGALPAAQLRAARGEWVRALATAAAMEDMVELRDPETRRNAVRGMLEASTTVGAADLWAAPSEHASGTLWGEVSAAMLAALDDYQTDNRGDVGSWVREAAMESLLEYLLLSSQLRDGESKDGESKPQHHPPIVAAAEAFATCLCQQASEKIDRMRVCAAAAAARLLLAPDAPPLADAEALTSVFLDPPAAADGTANGAAPSVVPEEKQFLVPTSAFPRVVALLALPARREATMRGLVVSAGGKTESTMRAARAALQKHCAAAADLAAVGAALLGVLDESVATPDAHKRLALASLLTTEQLLEDRALNPLLEAKENGFAADLLARVQRVCRGGKEVSLLVAGMGVQVLLLPFGGGDAKGEAWRAVLLLVAHRYPKVRKATADALYVHLLTYGEEALPPLPDDGASFLDADGNEAGAAAADPAAALEALNGLLLETPWLDNADAHAKPARAAMLATLGLRPPQQAAAPAAPAKPRGPEEGTYASLVGEVGY